MLLLEAAAETADPNTWLQVFGIGSSAAVLAGLFIWLVRLIMRSGKDARDENTRLDRQVAAQDKELDRLRRELDAERQRRFAVEDLEHADKLELIRLRLVIQDLQGDDK